ncbi:MAG: hypothetical protein JW893_00975 [Candidatus Omnitrophica bacterium]|nr:hypothetical protein [Candidatus Omnitrophota bacterium]
MKANPDAPDLNSLRQKLWIAYALVVFLVIGLIFATFPYWGFLLSSKEQMTHAMAIAKDTPHREEVLKVIGPLRYSGFRDLMKPDVYVTLDFEKKQWTIHNVHTFDEKGNVILAEGKYGVCGDLAIYAYQKLRPVFEEKYALQFVKVAEAGYFNLGRGSHIVIRVIDKTLPFGNPHKIFLLDPSYGRYGSVDLFDQYYPLEEFAAGSFKTDPPDEMSDLGGGPPILINDRAMLFFAVDGVGDQFDPNNYRFVLKAAKRYGYMNYEIFVIRKRNGKMDMLEKETPVSGLLPEKVYKKSKEVLQKLFQDHEQRFKSV